MICTLCGWVFDEAQAGQPCEACVFNHGCELVKCPNCGFELVPEGQPRTLSLAELKPRTRAVVVSLDTSQPSMLQKIIAVGALPKTELTLVQRFPSYVIQIGRSQFCMDRELASLIRVQRLEN